MERSEVLGLIAGQRDVLRGMGVVRLELFGSTARNEATDSSDVDILVSFDRPIGLLKLASVQAFLEDLLHHRVDLVPREALRPAIRDRVLAEAICAT